MKQLQKKPGIIIKKGFHSATFLPQVWEQLPNKENFLSELCSQKAGLPHDCYRQPQTHFKVFSAQFFGEQR